MNEYINIIYKKYEDELNTPICHSDYDFVIRPKESSEFIQYIIDIWNAYQEI